jgi:hypothetical protein
MEGDFERASGPMVIVCRSSTNAKGIPTGTHQLTLVIADGPFINDFSPQQTPPFYRHVHPDAHQVEVNWVVECPPEMP